MLWRTLKEIFVRHRPGTVGHDYELWRASEALDALAEYFDPAHVPGARLQADRELAATAFGPKKRSRP